MNRIYCGGLILAVCQHPPSGGQEENKMDKIMGWGKDSLIRKMKVTCEKEEKKTAFIHHSMPADRCPVNFWEAGNWYTWQSLQKADTITPNTITPNIPPFSFPPSLSWLSMMHTVWNIFWVSSDRVSQLSPLQTSCPSTACWPSGWWVGETAL